MPYDTTRDAFGNNIYAGPLSRTITDAAVMHSVMAGSSEKDPWALGSAIQRPLSPKLSGEDLSGVRVGYVELCANPRIAGDVRSNTRAALAAWETMGAEVEEVTEKIDWIEYEGRVLYQAGFSVSFAQYLPKWQNQMDPVTLAFMQRGDKFTLADFRNAQFARTVLFRKIQTLFERYDFIVTPTNARTALDVTHDAANDDVIIDGVKCGITRQGWTSYQYPFNLTGHPRARRALGLRHRRAADLGPDRRQVAGRDRCAAPGRAARAGAPVGAAPASSLSLSDCSGAWLEHHSMLNPCPGDLTCGRPLRWMTTSWLKPRPSRGLSKSLHSCGRP